MKPLAIGAAVLAVVCLPALRAQVVPPDPVTPPPAGGGGNLERLMVKIAGGQALAAADIGDLENTVVRIDEGAIAAAPGEVDLGTGDRRVYVLKVERRDDEIRELVEMQKTLLRSQLTILNALAAILRYQEHLESRVARSENLVRDLELEMRDVNRGLGLGRLDSASGLVVSRDGVALGEDINRNLERNEN